MKKKDLSLASFALALLGLLAYFWLSPSGLATAPDIRVTTLDESPVSLDKFRGKPLLVTFWATTCPGCVAEIPHLVRLHNELHDRGLNILAVAMAYDPPEQVRFMARQRGIPYTIALDTDGTVARAFGDVKLTPTTFLIDPKGRIVQQKLGEFDVEKIHQRIVEML